LIKAMPTEFHLVYSKWFAVGPKEFLIKEGSGILLVPAHLGYGNSDYSGIPGGSVLILK
jgi:hypothetical protein